MARQSWLKTVKDYHGHIQALLYLLSSILGLIVAVCVGIVLRNFQGTCFLFAQIVWNNGWVWPWSESSCDFIIYLNIAMTMAYALAMFCFTICALTPITRKHHKRVGRLQESHIRFVFQGMNPVFIVINSLVAALVLCAAGTLTGGFMKTCDWLVISMSEIPYLDKNDKDGNRLTYSCLDAQEKIHWQDMKVVRGITRGVDGSRFFNCYLIATIASWILVLVWSAQVFFSILVTCQACSCDVAEEKRKPDQSFLIASRRSRMATPIGTPGGRHTPVPLGQPMVIPSRGPPPQAGPPPSFKKLPSTSSYGQPPPRNEKQDLEMKMMQLPPIHPKGSSSSYA